ncbi:MAG: hypothetical protein GY790_19255 [Bacteroidetes bacterium]|nr:hypothetical protein [Bacteroidota bacterium]
MAKVGKGRFLWGYTPEEALRLLDTKQDFSCQLETPNEHGIDWVHRRDGDTDLYFVVNRAYEEVKLTANFRVSGKQPELWHPDNTEINTVGQFKVNMGITSVQLELAPFEATYRKTIDLPVSFLEGENVVLDLGDVRDLVDVRVNGKLISTLWKPPYRVKLGDALKGGENDLEITVANTWINRCIGDIRRHGRTGVKPENAPRYTQLGSATQDYNEETPILPSGLLGPLQLIVEKN